MNRTYSPRVDFVIWAGIGLVLFVSDLNGGLAQHSPAALAAGTGSLVALALPPYYAHLALLNRFFYRRQYGPYLLLTGLLLLGFGWAQQRAGAAIYRNPDGLGVEVVRLLLVLLVATGIRFYRDGLADRARQQERHAQQTAAELKLLRDQLNPHFLFNTLNNLYSLTLQQAAQAPEVVLKLAGLMRYMLEQTPRPRIGLAQELNFLRDYLALEQLRLGPRADIALHVSGPVASGSIAPLLLIPLVENAFKHGTAPAGQWPRVVVDVSLQGDTLFFAVTNRVGPPAAAATAARQTGLDNLRRRLAILYPQRHALTLENDGPEFRALLELRLTPDPAAVTTALPPATAAAHAH